jgi:hypothetical protein
MTIPMPPLMESVRVRVAMAHDVQPLLQGIPVRTSNICHVNS